MKRIIICAGRIDYVPLIDVDIIGVDYGAQFLAENKIQMILAIGDFDSVSNMEVINDYSDEVVVLNDKKDETDTESAIKWALSNDYDIIELYGALGGRIDHEYANMSLLLHREYPLLICDSQNRIYKLGSGKHDIKKDGYKYISFFALDDVVITLKDVKYPLTERHITPKDILGVSNEIIGKDMKIELSGSVLVIQSNDK